MIVTEQRAGEYHHGVGVRGWKLSLLGTSSTGLEETLDCQSCLPPVFPISLAKINYL